MKNENNEIKLADWVEQMMNKIERFAGHWNENRGKDQKQFPSHLTLDEWNQQFDYFNEYL